MTDDDNAPNPPPEESETAAEHAWKRRSIPSAELIPALETRVKCLEDERQRVIDRLFPSDSESSAGAKHERRRDLESLAYLDAALAAARQQLQKVRQQHARGR